MFTIAVMKILVKVTYGLPEMIHCHKAFILVKSAINTVNCLRLIDCLVFTTIGCSKVGQAWIFHTWQFHAWPVLPIQA